MKYYYLINGQIMLANEKMPVITNPNNNSLVYGDTYIKRWHSSLQPGEISESELENIKLHLAVNKQLCAFRDSPIDVTDIISDNNGVISFKEHPKQVGEIEGVENQDTMWLEIRDIIITEPSVSRIETCKQKFTITRNI